MRTERKTVDQVVFEEEDFKKLGLEQHAKLGENIVIMHIGGQYYVCEIEDKKDYKVIGAYRKDGN